MRACVQLLARGERIGRFRFRFVRSSPMPAVAELNRALCIAFVDEDRDGGERIFSSFSISVSSLFVIFHALNR